MDEITVFIVGFFVVIGLVFGLAYAGDRKACYDQADIMGVEWDYGFFQGCFFEVGDRWVPADSYRSEELNSR